jgi:hypothetical protein
MANDRMYLRCDTCGGQKLLAKSFGRGWQPWFPDMAISDPLFNPNNEFADLLEQWFDDHNHGNPNSPRFSIKYEVRDNA